MRKVSIIIPIKNEPHIDELVKNINRVLPKIKHEIIIVDKSDKPPKIKDAKLVIQKSDGLGNAVIEGLKSSTGDVIITMDGDGSHRPEDLPELIEKTKNFDIVIGSKYVTDGRTEDKLYRIIISKIFCTSVSFFLGLNVKDNMSGFGAVRRKVYEKIKPNPRGFKINMELLYKAKKFRFKATEVPILFLKRRFGKSKGTLREGFRTIRFILELKLGLK